MVFMGSLFLLGDVPVLLFDSFHGSNDFDLEYGLDYYFFSLLPHVEDFVVLLNLLVFLVLMFLTVSMVSMVLMLLAALIPMLGLIFLGHVTFDGFGTFDGFSLLLDCDALNGFQGFYNLSLVLRVLLLCKFWRF